MATGRGRAAEVRNIPPPSGGTGRETLIAEALAEWKPNPVRFLEIGYDKGHLYNLLSAYLTANAVEYISVDILDVNPGPHRYVKMDSTEFWKTLPVEEFYHVIFVDGCHCDGHADVDVKGSLLHLVVNGTLLVHDTGVDDSPGVLQTAGGPARAYLRNCHARDGISARIDRRHGEGMAIAVKRKMLGSAFLLETEEAETQYTCTLRMGQKVGNVRDNFPLYFNG